jgi:formate-dependent nitrite reductase membrane component NrfD
MLKTLVILASIANCAGGLVLIFTWATISQRVPVIVLFIGVSLLIQGGYTILYLRGDLDSWGNLATGALFAGEGLSACVGAGGLIQGIIHNINNADMEMAPVLAGLLMLVQALLALLYLFLAGRLRPRVNGRSSA